MTIDTSPPAFNVVNTIDLVSIKDSKVVSVGVYSGRAEITRLFKFNVKTGQNQLNIVGPFRECWTKDFFRVEGRGAATIHDVTISTITLILSPTLESLNAHGETSHMHHPLHAEHLDVCQLQEVVRGYDTTAGELDDKVTELEEQLKETEEAITQERNKLTGPTGNEKLNLKATIEVFADFEGEIKIALIYDTSPPAFQVVNTIDLVSTRDSKIISVSVYSGRAEVTRLFKFNVKTGQNQLNIVGLPRVLDKESFRVEGRGAATIHDVTISSIAPPPVPTTSPALDSLLAKKKQDEKALARVQKSLNSLETYLKSVKAQHLDVSKLQEVVREYDTTAGELDDKVTELEKQLEEADEAIAEERKRLAGPTGNEKLNLKATIGVFADFEGEIKIALIYAVSRATWSAGYDIRVDMQAKEKPISLIYKASINQSTGEDWDDVPLTLETATPTFGVGVPVLTPWTLSVYRPEIYFKKRALPTAPMMGAPPPPPPGPLPVPMFSRRSSSSSEDAEIQYRGLQVSSKGNVSATFGVPGLISIPSDGEGHNVTIVKLSLDADMSWVCVPKKDSRVHLKAKIKNASEYTLLAGNASVYVDGSFISKSEVPLVSPDESFDCPLGLDPSIRITYHPRSKKTSRSGFYNKSTMHSYSQRITVHNTKSSSAGGGTDDLKIKIIDQVPVSQDSTINVKLVQPSLVLPNAEGVGTVSSAAGSSEKAKLPPPLKVSSGVVATWDGADEVSLGQGQVDVDVDALGREGRLCWICSVAPQSKVGLVLQWEVSAPLRTDITGL
ncbi:unnamed protein product [Cyclocybe aegerita]|uniref:Mucoidy inhibitor A n=1 Tax=Cyclocybe aegerita TaxID=1973307 RepID=A0A8S0WTS6_CYCAE|nr:unnamed protein product [Cyclocybe aegerita]